MRQKKTLGDLCKGSRAVILGFELGPEDKSKKRLLEMGFLEGASVEIVHEAPFGKDPIAVRIRGTLFGLRRVEAHRILVGLVGEEV